MTTQSIIVYRNPLEQQLWEGVMNGNFFPIIVGIFVFFVVLLSINTFVIRKFYGWGKRSTNPTYIALVFSACLGIGVIGWMM